MKLSKRKIFLLLSVVIVSCSSSNGQLKNESKTSTIKTGASSKLNLGFFTIIPKEIDGCNCVFYISKKNKEEGKYVCVNDFTNLAFVKINEKMEKFELTENKKDTDVYNYKNQYYDLRIEITKKIPESYETSSVEGVITIKTKEGDQLEQIFIGLCGC